VPLFSVEASAVKVTERNTLSPILEVKETTPRRQASAASQGEIPDRVSISDEAMKMKKADAERIAKIATAIAEGRYKVDLEKLAEALVRKEVL
jgi:flagellar biosynthesis anti-sigma factor FlgM